MIKLAEILHTIKDEKESNMTPLDRWNMLHADFLEDMGFKPDGIDHYALENPRLKISHQKEAGFVLDDEVKKQRHIFKSFKALTEFFSNYEQKWENAPYSDEGGENNPIH